MPERKTLNEDLFYKGSSANLPRLHTCENKTPFWDKSKPFASQHEDVKPQTKKQKTGKHYQHLQHMSLQYKISNIARPMFCLHT